MNPVLGPATFTTGCSPIVFVTTPPQPASNARMMFVSVSVGGADASRNGFSNRSPVKTTERSTAIGCPLVDPCRNGRGLAPRDCREAPVDDREAFSPLRFGDGQWRVREERVPAHEGVQ